MQRFWTLGLAALVCLSLTAPSHAKMKVVTTFTVIADMAQNVAGDAAQVVSITKPGAEIHGYQPTPRDIVKAQKADLVLWNGLNLELWFQQFFDSLADVPAVTLTDGIKSISIAEGSYEGKPNPHAWMGLENALIYVANIRDAFSKTDPDNAAIYAANAAAYQAEIKAAIGPLKDQLAALPESKRWLVSCEGAFSYLAQDLGLKELYLWPMNADQVGTPKQIKRVIDTVKDQQIPAVFCESTVNTDPAKQVARQTGAHYGGVLYVDSLTGKRGAVPTYLDMLRVTTETLVSGLKHD